MASQNKGKLDWSSEVNFELIQELKLLKELEPQFKTKKWKHIATELKKKGFSRS